MRGLRDRWRYDSMRQWYGNYGRHDFMAWHERSSGRKRIGWQTVMTASGLTLLRVRISRLSSLI